MGIFLFKEKTPIIVSIMAFLCCILMVLLPEVALVSARKGIKLWMTDVFPALLPFFICANFLCNIGVIKLFKSGAFPFIMSVLSGYPMGAKIIGDLRRKDDISLKEGMRLMSFCSTSGPAYIVGAVGVGMLGSGKFGMMIAASHYIGALINGMVYSRLLKVNKARDTEAPVFYQMNIQEKFTDAILMSFKSLSIILAYIVLFMLVSDVLQMCGVFALFDKQWVVALLKGFFEMTVGCETAASCIITSEQIKCIICSFIISWGGMSIIGQTMSMLIGSGISISYILMTKLSHAVFSSAAAFAITSFVL